MELRALGEAYPDYSTAAQKLKEKELKLAKGFFERGKITRKWHSAVFHFEKAKDEAYFDLWNRGQLDIEPPQSISRMENESRLQYADRLFLEPIGKNIMFYENPNLYGSKAARYLNWNGYLVHQMIPLLLLMIFFWILYFLSGFRLEDSIWGEEKASESWFHNIGNGTNTNPINVKELETKTHSPQQKD